MARPDRDDLCPHALRLPARKFAKAAPPLPNGMGIVNAKMDGLVVIGANTTITH
jgi:hypothetical protein